MNLASIRVIADDVRRMVAFYEAVTGLEARWATDQFAEIVTPACTLAIGGAATVDLFCPGAAAPGENRTVIIELLVGDVDAEHARLAAIVPAFEQEPTTMPWGNRSMLLRDPEGNLVNVFTPVGADAVARFGLT